LVLYKIKPIKPGTAVTWLDSMGRGPAPVSGQRSLEMRWVSPVRKE